MPDGEPLSFAWDLDKAETNLEQHGIDFVDAVKVFDGDVYEVAIVRNAELRYKAIGLLEGVEIAVVYTQRGRVCRIISARRAKKREREAYKAACTLSRG